MVPKISRIDWENYLRRMRLINEAAADALKQWVEEWGRDEKGAMLLNILEAVDNWDQDIIDTAYMICQEYGNASAATAAAMYDATAELEGKILPAAEMADNPPYWEVEKTVRGTLKSSQNIDELAGAVSRLVKRTGVDTTMKNAIRDGAEWAWIPNGDTCAFCLTLASRGWQKASAAALKGGHAEHIHSNCDCTYAIRHSSDMDVAGYDPDKYLKMYYDADGTKPKDRINAMRREQYAKNKDKINAQKRAAYAKKNPVVISDVKFHGYALNPEKEPNKAKVFKSALGYTRDNYEGLKSQIIELFDVDKLQSKGNNGYGELFEQVMKIHGENGNTANVCTGWILKTGDLQYKLTSLYVTKKKMVE